MDHICLCQRELSPSSPCPGHLCLPRRPATTALHPIAYGDVMLSYGSDALSTSRAHPKLRPQLLRDPWTFLLSMEAHADAAEHHRMRVWAAHQAPWLGWLLPDLARASGLKAAGACCWPYRIQVGVYVSVASSKCDWNRNANPPRCPPTGALVPPLRQGSMHKSCQEQLTALTHVSAGLLAPAAVFSHEGLSSRSGHV